MFIGKKLARKLPHGFLIVNRLRQAERMLYNGVDPSVIKKETGWEWGADGLPRYEIADPRITFPTEDRAIDLMMLLPESDLKTCFALIDDYWQKDIEASVEVHIMYNDSSAEGTHGVTRGKEIWLWTGKDNPDTELEGALLHELQHMIQDYEGFAKGTSVRYVSDESIISSSSNLRHKRDEMESYLENKPWVRVAFFFGIYKLKQDLINYYRNNDKGYEALRLDFSKSLREERIRAHERQDDLYNRTIGEVEARNVEKRMGMLPLERKNSLGAATEDVERTRQVFPESTREIVEMDDFSTYTTTIPYIKDSVSLEQVIESFSKRKVDDFRRRAVWVLQNTREKYMPIPRNINGHMYLSFSLVECLNHMNKNKLVIPYFLTEQQARDLGLEVDGSKRITTHYTTQNGRIKTSYVFALEETNFKEIAPSEFEKIYKIFTELQYACFSSWCDYILPSDQGKIGITKDEYLRELINTACIEYKLAHGNLPSDIKVFNDINEHPTYVGSKNESFLDINMCIKELESICIIPKSHSVTEILSEGKEMGSDKSEDLAQETDTAVEEEAELVMEDNDTDLEL